MRKSPRLRMALTQAARGTARAVALLLLLIAAYVSAGRLLAPLAGTQRAEIEAALGEALGVPVEIAALRGSWRGFSPQLEVEGLVIHNPAEGPEAPGLRVDQGVIQLDVPESLWRKTWVIGSLQLRAPALEAVQDRSGRWRLAGLRGGDPQALQRFSDVLLNTAVLDVEDASLLLRPQNLPPLRLEDLHGQLRNAEGRHRLWLEGRPAGAASPWQLRLDLDGDPRGAFAGEAWAELGLDSTLPLLQALPQPPLEVHELGGRLRLWAGFQAGALDRLQGRLAGAGLAASLDQGQELRLDQAALTLTALRQDGDDWRVLLEDLGFQLNGLAWPAGDLQARLDLGAQAPRLEVGAERVALPVLAAALRLSGRLPERGQSVLDTLQPAGRLNNLRLSLDLARPQDFRLRANLADVSVQAWNAAPAGSGLRGYVEAGLREGFVELDSSDFSLHLPRLFPQPWHYQRANARVHWSYDRDSFEVRSSPIAAANADLDGRAQFELRGWRDAERWQSELGLLVGVSRMEAAAKSLYLPRLQSLAATMTWLDTAIRDGRLRDSGFAFRGLTRRGTRPEELTVQSFYRFEDVDLEYLPDWPQLRQAEGLARVMDARAEIALHGGRIDGLRLRPASAVLARADSGPGFWLDIAGGADAGSAAGLDFLRDSPLRASLGGFMDDWRASGGIDVDLKLRVPLGMPGRRPDIGVAVSTGDSNLFMDDLDLAFEGLAGSVRYDSASGLQAEGLGARLFGQPVGLAISSSAVASSSPQLPFTRIRVQGQVGTADLAGWRGLTGALQALLPHAQGRFDYQAELALFREAQTTYSRLSLRSPLRGLALALPAPFAKPAEELRELALDIDFRDGRRVLDGRLGGELSARLELGVAGLERGLVYFGPLNRDFSVRESSREERGLLVTGELASLDLDAWRPLLEGARMGGEQAAAGLRLLDLRVGELQVLGRGLDGVTLQLSPQGEGWRIFLDNAQLRGALFSPAQPGQPWRVDLDHLRLPARETPPEPSGVERPDPLQALDPSSLPAVDFVTREFSVGSTRLGAWSFRLLPQEAGLRVEELRAELPGASIEGLEEGSAATLDWQYADGRHESVFHGRFRAGDLAQVLPGLGYGANVQSRDARLSGTLAWPGSPAAFALARSSGEVGLRIDGGRFVDVEPGGARLLGALSLDAIVRRLQLDFSDLFGRGYAFDSIDGRLHLRDGLLRIQDSLRIDGPSSKIDVTGNLDLPRQHIDVELLVKLPLSENLSVLAGLLGAWPVAVGTYVAGKLFEEQVAGITSVLYHLEGPWNDLDTNFAVPAQTAAEPDASP